jgi:hypothetical protein
LISSFLFCPGNDTIIEVITLVFSASIYYIMGGAFCHHSYVLLLAVTVLRVFGRQSEEDYQEKRTTGTRGEGWIVGFRASACSGTRAQQQTDTQRARGWSGDQGWGTKPVKDLW